MTSLWNRTLRTVGRALRRTPTQRPADRRTAPGRTGDQHRDAHAQPRPADDHAEAYDVGQLGLPRFEYVPRPDDLPDPGEVVWTWVPYEDDPNQGKDRPVLVLARTGASVVVAQMTSKDHDRDAEQEARYGRYWMDIGSGEWDGRHRASEIRLDRLLRVPMKDVRRTSGTLDKRRYDEVITAVRKHHQVN